MSTRVIFSLECRQNFKTPFDHRATLWPPQVFIPDYALQMPEKIIFDWTIKDIRVKGMFISVIAQVIADITLPRGKHVFLTHAYGFPYDTQD